MLGAIPGLVPGHNMRLREISLILMALAFQGSVVCSACVGCSLCVGCSAVYCADYSTVQYITAQFSLRCSVQYSICCRQSDFLTIELFARPVIKKIIENVQKMQKCVSNRYFKNQKSILFARIKLKTLRTQLFQYCSLAR